MTHLLHPQADEEFAAAVRYYSEISPELSIRFYLEMERLMREVCAHPDWYWKFDPPARRHLSRDFPYAVVFVERPEHVWILAVMHTKREPGYWRGRVS